MELTLRAGHALELAKQYGTADCGLILVGGDGTIHEAMDGLLENGTLQDVTIALLSQGTMNFYWHSGCLPSPAELPDFLKNNSSRKQSLMKVKDDPGKMDTMCFEAIYLGVGYRPAQGAQEWRNSYLGPFFGIMYNIIKCNLFPASTAIEGTLTIWPSGSSNPIVVTDSFFWIVITQRNPYNGTLTEDEMWVSYLSLNAFPGFGRMMDSFAPPMECQSGLVNLMEAHYKVSKCEWNQSVGSIGVCLDGDPMQTGSYLMVEHVPRAWNIVAEKAFPRRVADEVTRILKPTEAATRWLADPKNAPGKETYVPKGLNNSYDSSKSQTVLLLGGLGLALAAYFWLL